MKKDAMLITIIVGCIFPLTAHTVAQSKWAATVKKVQAKIASKPSTKPAAKPTINLVAVRADEYALPMNFDAIKQQLSAMGLSEEEIWARLKSSNTILRDSAMDMDLAYALKIANDQNAEASLRQANRQYAAMKIDALYATMNTNDLVNTAWLIGAESEFKKMALKQSIGALDLPLSPEGLRDYLNKRGEGGFLGASGGSGYGGAGGVTPITGTQAPAGRGGGIGSMIGCLDNYKKSKGQGSPATGGGGDGGGATNPGGMGTGGDSGGGWSGGGRPTVTDGSDDSTTTEGGSMEGTGAGGGSGCFGIDMGKLKDYANEDKGKDDKGGNKDGSEKTFVEASGEFTKGKVTKQKTEVTITKNDDGTYKVNKKTSGDNIAGLPKADGKSFSLGDHVPKESAGKIRDKVLKDAGDSYKSAGMETKGDKYTNNLLGLGAGSHLNPEADAGTPCGADVAGLSACIQGTSGLGPMGQLKQLALACQAQQASKGGGGNPPPGGGSDQISSGLAKGNPNDPCGKMSPGCMNFLLKSPVTDYEQDFAPNCGSNAEALGYSLQAMITDPVDFKGNVEAAQVGQAAQEALKTGSPAAGKTNMNGKTGTQQTGGGMQEKGDAAQQSQQSGKGGLP